MTGDGTLLAETEAPQVSEIAQDVETLFLPQVQRKVLDVLEPAEPGQAGTDHATVSPEHDPRMASERIGRGVQNWTG